MNENNLARCHSNVKLSNPFVLLQENVDKDNFIKYFCDIVDFIIEAVERYFEN